MSSSPRQQDMHAPYLPKVAGVGGRPTVNVDVPVCAVFLALFLAGAAGHMTIFQINRRRGHKFIISALMFGFCMARIVTMIMRIAWACYPGDASIAIAAMIFVSAGVLILFLVNLIFAQRILRATHPHFGWHKALSRVFLVLYLLIPALLVMVITATVQSFYTLNKNTHMIDRDLQLTGSTYFLSISFLPIPMVILGLVIPQKTRVEEFGSGRWRTKVAILLLSATLLCLGAAFRTGTSFKNPRPIDHPAWYHAKWCFYFFNFTIEIIVVYIYLFLRVDRRFHIPDGSKGAGDYHQDQIRAEKDYRPTSGGSETLVLSEEEVVDHAHPPQQSRVKG